MHKSEQKVEQSEQILVHAIQIRAIKWKNNNIPYKPGENKWTKENVKAQLLQEFISMFKCLWIIIC